MDWPSSFSLRRETLCRQIANQIEEMIICEFLQPDDRLPGERELSERFGVSRTVIREALCMLSVRGLVEVRHGSGTYVRTLTPQDAAAPLELLLRMRQAPDLLIEFTQIAEIFEVRRIFEMEIAGFAALRATAADCAALEATIERMAAETSDVRQFLEDDQAFHLALATAAHNKLFVVLLMPVSGLLVSMGEAFSTRSLIKSSLISHRAIMERVNAKDADGARRAMREHLDEAEHLMAVNWEAVRRSSICPESPGIGNETV